jgi:hypothetical protein
MHAALGEAPMTPREMRHNAGVQGCVCEVCGSASGGVCWRASSQVTSHLMPGGRHGAVDRGPDRHLHRPSSSSKPTSFDQLTAHILAVRVLFGRARRNECRPPRARGAGHHPAAPRSSHAHRHAVQCYRSAAIEDVWPGCDPCMVMHISTGGSRLWRGLSALRDRGIGPPRFTGVRKRSLTGSLSRSLIKGG